MENKKAYEPPESGVFYMIPNPKTGKYTIYSQQGDEALHLVLWNSICTKLQMSWKINEDLFEPYYTGLPRGRIALDTRTNDWIVGIGNDFPVKEYRDDIIKEFNMRDTDNIGKVKFELQDHEKMSPSHKKHVEELLGIKMSPTGFTIEKKVTKKKI